MQRKYLPFIAALIGCYAIIQTSKAQSSQNFANVIRADINQKKKTTPFSTDDSLVVWGLIHNHLPTLGLYGIGNVNTETFTNVNSSGKLSGYIYLQKWNSSFIKATFSYNVNASNTDSLLPSTFLFPDVGRNSFLLNAEWTKVYWSQKTDISCEKFVFLSPFAELSTKSIKGSRGDSTKFFNTLNWVFGFRYLTLYLSEKDNFSFSISPFIAMVNVPNEDNSDYRYLFTGNAKSSLNSLITSLGCKLTFQYNKLQFFADLRHVLGNESSVPIRELRGFSQNIGVLFNADFFEK